MSGDIEISIANNSRLRDVLEFQRRYIKEENQAVYAREFYCEIGLRGAINKNNVLVAYSNHLLAGMMRFYCQVRQQQISIYQFAVAEEFRGTGLTEKMFAYLQNQNAMDLVSKCPMGNDLNRFYKKKYWALFDHQSGLNYWKKPIIETGLKLMELDADIGTGG